MSDIPTIDTLPEFPDRRYQGAQYSEKATAWAAGMVPFGQQLNTLAAYVAERATAATAAVAAGSLSGLNMLASAGKVVGVNATGTGLTFLPLVRAATDAEAAEGQGVDAYVQPDQVAVALRDAAARVLIVREEHASGASGVNGVAGGWAAYNLNAQPYAGIAGAAVSGGRVTLPAGTYQLSGYGQAANTAFGSNTSRYKCRLFNVTDGVTQIVGASGTVPTYGGDELGHGDTLSINGVFTITAPKVFELQTWFNGGGGGRLFITAGAGENEIFAELVIRKLAN